MARRAKIGSCLIVGAGISGLLVAQSLQREGIMVTVLDEGRSIGGRMATRHLGEATFGHGAQFFTVRSDRFGELVEGWVKESVAKEWSRGFPTPQETTANGHPRYRGAGGMSSIPGHLAQGLDVRTGERAVRLSLHESRWRLAANSGETYETDALIVTTPASRALTLAESGEVRLPNEDRAALTNIVYAPCVALMVRLQEGESPVPDPGGLQIKSEPLDWISDNRLKGISAAPGLTIHAGPEWSRRHYEAPDGDLIEALLGLAGGALGEDLSSLALETSVARWRHSWVTAPHPEPCLECDTEAPLIFAGDSFGQPKVEGAALSGLAAADRLLGRD